MMRWLWVWAALCGAERVILRYDWTQCVPLRQPEWAGQNDPDPREETLAQVRAQIEALARRRDMEERLGATARTLQGASPADGLEHELASLFTPERSLLNLVARPLTLLDMDVLAGVPGWLPWDALRAVLAAVPCVADVWHDLDKYRPEGVAERTPEPAPDAPLSDHAKRVKRGFARMSRGPPWGTVPEGASMDNDQNGSSWGEVHGGTSRGGMSQDTSSQALAPAAGLLGVSGDRHWTAVSKDAAREGSLLDTPWRGTDVDAHPVEATSGDTQHHATWETPDEDVHPRRRLGASKARARSRTQAAEASSDSAAAAVLEDRLTQHWLTASVPTGATASHAASYTTHEHMSQAGPHGVAPLAGGQKTASHEGAQDSQSDGPTQDSHAYPMAQNSYAHAAAPRSGSHMTQKSQSYEITQHTESQLNTENSDSRASTRGSDSQGSSGTGASSGGQRKRPSSATVALPTEGSALSDAWRAATLLESGLITESTQSAFRPVPPRKRTRPVGAKAARGGSPRADSHSARTTSRSELSRAGYSRSALRRGAPHDGAKRGGGHRGTLDDNPKRGATYRGHAGEASSRIGAQADKPLPPRRTLNALERAHATTAAPRSWKTFGPVVKRPASRTTAQPAKRAPQERAANVAHARSKRGRVVTAGAQKAASGGARNARQRLIGRKGPGGIATELARATHLRTPAVAATSGDVASRSLQDVCEACDGRGGPEGTTPRRLQSTASWGAPTSCSLSDAAYAYESPWGVDATAARRFLAEQRATRARALADVLGTPAPSANVLRTGQGSRYGASLLQSLGSGTAPLRVARDINTHDVGSPSKGHGRNAAKTGSSRTSTTATVGGLGSPYAGYAPLPVGTTLGDLAGDLRAQPDVPKASHSTTGGLGSKRAVRTPPTAPGIAKISPGATLREMSSLGGIPLLQMFDTVSDVGTVRKSAGPFARVGALPGVRTSTSSVLPFVRTPEGVSEGAEGAVASGDTPAEPAAEMTAPATLPDILDPKSLVKPLIIAVIDAGCDVTHPALRDRLWKNPGEICDNGIDDDGNGYVDDCHGWDFVRGAPLAPGPAPHGTGAASLLLGGPWDGCPLGLCENCVLMCLKFMDATSGRISDQLAALEYAVRHGARVSNNSYGGYGWHEAEHAALARAPAHLFVASAGNHALDTDARLHTPSGYALPHVAAVGASGARGARAPFSNFGARSVHVFAPGVDLPAAAQRGRAPQSGTSFATPLVTAALANVLLHLREVQIWEALMAAALDPTGPTPAEVASAFAQETYLYDTPLSAARLRRLLLNGCRRRRQLVPISNCGGIVSLHRLLYISSQEGMV